MRDLGVVGRCVSQSSNFKEEVYMGEQVHSIISYSHIGVLQSKMNSQSQFSTKYWIPCSYIWGIFVFCREFQRRIFIEY